MSSFRCSCERGYVRCSTPVSKRMAMCSVCADGAPHGDGYHAPRVLTADAFRQVTEAFLAGANEVFVGPAAWQEDPEPVDCTGEDTDPCSTIPSLGRCVACHYVFHDIPRGTDEAHGELCCGKPSSRECQSSLRPGDTCVTHGNANDVCDCRLGHVDRVAAPAHCPVHRTP